MLSSVMGITKTYKTKEMLERDEEYRDLCQSGKVKSYELSKEQIVEKYGEVSKEKRKTTRGFQLYYVENAEGKKVIFNAELVKKDILEGLNKGEVFEKYSEITNNIKGRIFNMAVKELLRDEIITEEEAEHARKNEEVEKVTIGEVVEAKEEKKIEVIEEVKEVKEVQEVQEAKLLRLKNIQISGDVASYEINEKLIMLRKGNIFITIDRDKVDDLINELEELKEYVR